MLSISRAFLPFLILMLIGSTPSIARAGNVPGVREKITRYEELSSRFASAALTLSYNKEQTTSFRNVDTKEQFCLALIDLLGIEPGSSFQSVQSEPEFGSNDPTALLLYSASLRSYVKAAKTLLVDLH